VTTADVAVDAELLDVAEPVDVVAAVVAAELVEAVEPVDVVAAVDAVELVDVELVDVAEAVDVEVVVVTQPVAFPKQVPKQSVWVRGSQQVPKASLTCVPLHNPEQSIFEALIQQVVKLSLTPNPKQIPKQSLSMVSQHNGVVELSRVLVPLHVRLQSKYELFVQHVVKLSRTPCPKQ